MDVAHHQMRAPAGAQLELIGQAAGVLLAPRVFAVWLRERREIRWSQGATVRRHDDDWQVPRDVLDETIGAMDDNVVAERRHMQ